MAKRKQTPDVLAEILGGDPAAGQPERVLPPAPVAAPPEPAARWEYCVVTFQDYKGWRPRYINGRELKDWIGGILLHEYLNEMAAEGWELAAASAGERLYGSSDHHQLYFRRLQT